MGEGFSRLNRLTAKQEFQNVFASLQKLKTKLFIARYCLTQNGRTRLGIIVSKLAIKQAVRRNQIRRIIRESFRNHQNLLKGLDIVIVIRSECIPHDKKSLRIEIDKLWLLLKDTCN